MSIMVAPCRCVVLCIGSEGGVASPGMEPKPGSDTEWMVKFALERFLEPSTDHFIALRGVDAGLGASRGAVSVRSPTPDWLPEGLLSAAGTFAYGSEAVEVDAGAGGGPATIEDAIVSYLNGLTPGAPDRVDIAIVGARAKRGFLRRAVTGSVSR